MTTICNFTHNSRFFLKLKTGKNSNLISRTPRGHMTSDRKFNFSTFLRLSFEGKKFGRTSMPTSDVIV